MTRISRIVMSGFKSFAFKTELIFGERFNVILGPNGSGKSNVLDAICFCLGKGSTRELRAEKAANFIYNGGKTKEPAKHGEVSIYFDNAGRTFPTDEPFVKISRIVKESGQSTYRINDKIRTRQQVLELLSIAKINPDGYNIILQGDIVKFVEMSTEDRRRVLEEIAGISVYEEKKAKALRELERVEARFNEAEVILKERKTYIDELQKDRDQALKYKDAGSKIKQNRASLLHFQIKDKNTELAERTKAQDERKAEVAKIQEEIVALKKEIEQKNIVIKEINDQVERQGELEQVKVHKEVEQIRVDMATARTRILSLDNELGRLAQRKEQLAKSEADIMDKVQKLEITKADLKKQETQNRKDLTIIEKKIAKFREDQKLDQAGNMEKEIVDLDNAAEQKQKDIQALREEQQDLMRQKDRFEFQLQGIDQQIEKVLSVAKEQKDEILQLKNMKQEFKRITLQLNTFLNEDSSLAAQLQNARTKLATAHEDLARAQAQEANLKERMSLGTAIEKILENKEKFGGVHGTVSELGKVKTEYALALDVAAGPRTRSLVVDNDETAASCIRWLKQGKFGVATFLPLNRIRAEQSRPVENLGARGVIGKAIDLIEYDPQFKKIFQYVFSDTIVVESLEVAKRIGIGRIRMVTLDGDLCELSGAMHGGFRRKEAHLGFQQKEITANLEKKESAVADLESVVSVLENRKKESDEKITQLRTEKANLEGEIIKLEKSLHLEEGDLDASKTLKKEIADKLKDAEKGLMASQGKIAVVNTDLAQLKVKKGQLRGQITELRNPTLLAELNAFEQKRGELQAILIGLQGELNNMEMQANTILLPEKENILKIVKQHEKEEQAFTKEKVDLEATIKGNEAALKEKEKAEKEFYAKFKELFVKRNKISDDIQAFEGKTIRKEEQIRAAEQRSNAVSLDIARIKAELSGLDYEYKQYEGVGIVEKPIETLKREIAHFEKVLADFGSVNLKALEIYETVEKEYRELLAKKDILVKEKEDVLLMMNEIDTKKKDLFLKTFDRIQNRFQEIFSTLTTKGSAELIIEDMEHLFEAGVRIRVKVTGKKFLDIRSLSGGEKTLTALALIFAIQEYEPASFYVLDEVDAALDKRNSEKLAKLIRQYSEKAQYVMISHNDNIISEADILYGVSMNEHGMSKVVSLKI
ncbi:MAG: chromosome segregation protein SMC [Nanoarchaeota archaeon]